MSIYGWLYWKFGKQKSAVAITFASFKEKLIATAIMIVGYIILFYTLWTYTDSDVPHLDALVSATAWAGMWLMAKRKVENWLLLNLSNIVAIFLFWYKEVYLYSVLSLILFIVAVFGYINWKKLANSKQ